MNESTQGRTAIGNPKVASQPRPSPVSSLQSLVSSLQLLALPLILALAAFLRFFRLDHSSLWSDEGNTWALMARSFAQIARDAAADIHPPGYYWLLKGWTMIAGADAWGLRSFSAAIGALLVWMIYHIALTLFATPSSDPKASHVNPKTLALLAALIATLSPFLVYYSQEARMYMLLALAGAGLFWATLRLMRPASGARLGGWPALVYLVSGVIGLWTHYSFPVVLAAIGCAWLAALVRAGPIARQSVARFLLLNGLVVAAFMPWAPTAMERVLAWPKGGEAVGALDALQLTLRTLLVGPLRAVPEPLWPWLFAAGCLPLLGLWALRRTVGVWALALWLLAPIGLMLALGLYSDAFLKFLLVAAPAWCITLAAAPRMFPIPQSTQIGLHTLATLFLALAVSLFALRTLPPYYGDATARDNYAGVARYVAAVGDPATDLVLLNAPGQQEVWAYYDPGLPVLALPQQRPPDRAQTVAALHDALAGRRQLFVLFWATAEADPERIVEGWLNQQPFLFKGVESWQGNLRFLTYHQAGELECQPLPAPVRFGDVIALRAQCLQMAPVAAGDVALVGLEWGTEQAIQTRYAVSVQLLDPRGQVIAQHDGEPQGGAAPTTTWMPGSSILDNRGVWIPFGAPPGVYRLIAALYDPIAGQRLSTPYGDAAELGQIEVVRPERAVPLEIVPMQHRLGHRLGPVTLVGYDLYRKGFAHAPKTPLAAGDLAHIVLYWQAPDPLPGDWPADLRFTIRLGAETVSAPLAGGALPTGAWRPGELVRAEFDLRYDGAAQHPWLAIDDTQTRLGSLPR